MGGFLLRKVGAALIVLVLASMLIFVGVRAIPGDPAIALGAESRDPALIAAIRHKYLLDRPLPVQYAHWVWLALHGDLGVDQRELSVAHTIVTRIPITLELAVPHFWLGLLFIIWFAVDLHWLPASGYVTMHHPIANVEHMVMPAIVLGTGFAAVLMRQMRSSMLSSLGADYVRTARAKGLPEWSVILKHALRNSLITVTTVIG